MEPLLQGAELNFIERCVHNEVEVIMTQENVTNRGDLYNKVTKSLLRGEPSLQVCNCNTSRLTIYLLSNIRSFMRDK